MNHPLTALAGYFALLSLFAVGGANAAIPEMHRISVDVMRWMTDRQFADMFAIAQVSPGPNVIIVARTWDRFKQAHWRIAIQSGLVPLSLGLIGASAFVLARTADNTIYAGLITAATAAVAFFTRVNPLWLVVAAGLLGLSGWL